MTYDDFILLINNSYVKIIFKVRDYKHYDCCQIERKKQDLKNGNKIDIVSVKLTQDNTETIGFLDKYNESLKIFNFGRKGKATLKECWKLIEIVKIIEA